MNGANPLLNPMARCDAGDEKGGPVAAAPIVLPVAFAAANSPNKHAVRAGVTGALVLDAGAVPSGRELRDATRCSLPMPPRPNV